MRRQHNPLVGPSDPLRNPFAAHFLYRSTNTFNHSLLHIHSTFPPQKISERYQRTRDWGGEEGEKRTLLHHSVRIQCSLTFQRVSSWHNKIWIINRKMIFVISSGGTYAPSSSHPMSCRSTTAHQVTAVRRLAVSNDNVAIRVGVSTTRRRSTTRSSCA